METAALSKFYITIIVRSAVFVRGCVRKISRRLCRRLRVSALVHVGRGGLVYLYLSSAKVEHIFLGIHESV